MPQGKRCPLCDKPQNFLAKHKTTADCIEESRRFCAANTPNYGLPKREKPANPKRR